MNGASQPMLNSSNVDGFNKKIFNKMENKVVDNREEQRIEPDQDMALAIKMIMEKYGSNYTNERHPCYHVAPNVFANLMVEFKNQELTTEAERNKEDAIGFAEWLSHNQFTMYNNVWTSTKIHYAPDKFNLEQLYEIYHNRINQKV